MNKRTRIILALGIAIAIGALAFGIHLARTPGMPGSYAELIALPADQLRRVDIGLMNLLCAEGLPGAEGLDIGKSLATLDQWAELVKRSEQERAGQFSLDRRRYDDSYALFQAVNLGLTLKEDLKCGYNQELIRSGAMDDIQSTRFFRDSRDLFLHGFVEARTGSCSSLPVLMVAVGRRCGYPLHLVACKGHLFCRWDDGKERFNIETACPGVDSKPDAYYRQWPLSASDSEIRTEKYLQNLDANKQLAVFVRLRATCLEENKRFEEAEEAYAFALETFPESELLKAYRENAGRRKSE